MLTFRQFPRFADQLLKFTDKVDDAESIDQGVGENF